MAFTKPPRLKRGDTVAVLSPSGAAPHRFPTVYERGLRTLEERFGLRVKEYPTARAGTETLAKHPEARAEDVNRAFADEDVQGIIASIGGDDSLRILPHIDRAAIRAHPKVLMGFSDTTTLLTWCNQLGLVTFHGPSVMAGFSQLDALPPQFRDHIREMLFDPPPTLEYRSYGRYSDGYPDWRNPENLGKVNPPRGDAGWHWLQGSGAARGPLYGGNIEVLEWLKGTRFWPDPGFWDGKILFLETSEEVPSPLAVRRWLRNYGLQGILGRIAAILFGRARGYSDAQKRELDEVLVSVVAEEIGRTDLPIVSNLDFGHTDPQFILPLGAKAEVDCGRRSLRLLESAVA